MTRSVHDNHVLGYQVDSEAKRIIINTEYRTGAAPYERTKVRFEGVVGYLLLDCLDGVLFDIEESSLTRIMEDHPGAFAWGAKYGWPFVATHHEGSLEKYVETEGATVYRIQGQSCFDGFVISDSMVIEAT